MHGKNKLNNQTKLTQGSETAHWVKKLASKPDDPSSIFDSIW